MNTPHSVNSVSLRRERNYHKNLLRFASSVVLTAVFALPVLAGIAQMQSVSISPFSPNQLSSAGNKDTTVLAAKNQGGGSLADFRIRIHAGSVSGTLVKEFLFGAVAGNTIVSVTWDGKNTGGAFVGDSTYVAVASTGITENTSSTLSIVIDNTNPSVTLNSPADNAYVSGSITLDATPLDGGSDANISSVEFYVDGSLVGSDGSSGGGWNVTYNSSSLADGDHIWTAKAYDNTGNNASAVTRIMTSQNTGSAAASISPSSGIAGTPVTYSITVTNTTSNVAITMGSIAIAIPSGASAPTGITVTATDPGPVSRTWSLDGSPPAGFFRVSRSGASNNDIDPGGTVVIQFTSTFSVTGPYEWTTTPYKNNNYTQPFIFQGSQPAVNICTAITITTNPSNQTACSGSSASFSASATSTPASTLQWQVSTNGGSTWTNIAGATSSPLTFTSSTSQNGYRYRGVFTNTCGSASTSSATLTVNSSPSVTTDPVNQEVCSNNSVSFSVAGSGTPSPTIQWQVSVDGGMTFSNISGTTAATLSFTALAADNGKKYRAVLTNSCGSTNSFAATLTTDVAPGITGNPADQTACAGSTASFTAAANGSPVPSVQWQVSSDGGTTFNNIGGATSGTYSFAASASDSGKRYRAVFTNTCGNATSASATLSISNSSMTIANAGPDQTVCATTAALAGNSPSGGTGAWTVVAGGATVTDAADSASGVTGLSVGINTFVWTISNGLCAPSGDTITILRNATSSGDTTVVACNSFTWYGTTYTATGNPTHTFINAAGCDSIVTLHLTINQSTTGDTTVVACNSFTWYGTTYNASATPTHTFTNAAGCDSVVTLHLTINQSTSGDTTATACDSFTWYGTTYTSTGTATHTFTNAAGCDSIVTLHLTVLHSTTGDTTVVACNSFTWYGTTYNASGTPTHTLTNAAGCDSVVTLHLTINQSTTGDTTVVACNSFTWYGTTYEASGTPTHTFTNAAGCDSVVTLHLTINHSSSGDTTAVACNSFTWYGTTYEASGTPTHTFTNAAGCDSVVTLHLTINHSSTGDTTVVACDSFTWYGTIYNASGTPTHTFTNAAGCDSVVTLHLTINHSTTGDTTAVACNSFTWYGTTYEASGTPTHTFTNAAGCDSVVTLHLTIHYSTTGDTTVVACDSFTWYGATYEASGTPTHTFTNAAGCDSVVTLHLTINHSNTGDTTVVACNSFTWYGTTYTASGTPTHTFTNAGGCDSVVTLHLTINYSTSGDTTAVACDSFTWYGTTYEASGTPTHTFTNAAGCDSVVTLHLTINHSSTGDTTAVACNSFTWYGTTYNASATPTHTFTNAAGCDSVVTLHLTINQSSTGDTTAVACNSFTWYGTTYTASGTPTHTFTNAAGCDSVVTLHLTINHSSTGDTTVIACNNFTWYGTTYTASGTPAHIFTNASGCDSVVTLHLTISNTVFGDTTVVACNSFTWYDTTYNVSGTPKHTFITALGCDSIVTLHLTINHTTTGDTTAVACNSFTWYGVTYDSSGTATHTFTNVAGCDSVVTLHLTIHHSNTGDTTAVACNSFTWYGTTYNASGTPTHTFTNAAGCDSVVTLHLTINHSTTGDTTAVACNSFAWYGTTYTASGTPTHTLTNAAGCDSVVTLHLTINQITTGDTTAVACNSFTWYGTTYDSSGTPTHIVTNAAGCDSVVTLHLTINKSPTIAAAGEDQTVCSSTAKLAGNMPSVGGGVWTVIAGGAGVNVAIPADPASDVTGLSPGVNTFVWTISNGTCPSSTDTVTIFRDAAPTTANAGPDQVISGTAATLHGNMPSIGAGVWSLVSGAGTISSSSDSVSGVTGLGVGPNVFTWTISNASCPSSFDSVIIFRKDPTVSILTASPNPSSVGQLVTLKDSVRAPVGGKVVFRIDGVQVGDSIVIDGSGVAAMTTSALTAGTHDMQAFYGGTATFDTSSSNTVSQTVLQLSITATAAANGSISPSGTINMTYGSDTTFTISPHSGYHILDVLVDGSSVGTPPTYPFTNVTANHTISATFGVDTLTITASASANGSITPNGSIMRTAGSSQAFTIAPDPHYHVDSLLVDGVKTDSTTSYTFTNILTNHSIRAVFVIDRFVISATASGNGVINPAGSISVNYASSQSFMMTPASHSHIDSVIVDGARVDSTTSYTFTNVSSGHAIRVVFAVDTYTITASAGANGSVTPSGAVTKAFGSSQSFALSPATGYHLDSVFVDGVYAGNSTPYMFTNISTNHTIQATFAINTYSITVASVGHGLVTPAGTITAVHGSSVAVNMIPDVHYGVDSIIVDGVSAGSMSGYTFNAITSNHTLTSYFGIAGGYALRYRSFTYDSLYARRATKKKPTNDYWEFTVTNTTANPVHDLKIEFKNFVREIVASGTLTSSGNRRLWNFHGTLNPGESVLISGWNVAPVTQTIRRMWFDQTAVVRTMLPRYEHRDLPMPNAADIRNDAFIRGAFSSMKGMVIGIPRPDSARYYGWVKLRRTNDMAISIGTRSVMHTGMSRGFDKRWNRYPYVREQRSNTPRKQNNRLFGDLMALKLNIGISMIGMTRAGFGELQFAENGSPFNRMLVRDIAARADSAMTLWKLPASYYAVLDSTIQKINRAFSGVIDTVSWWDTLRLKGTRQLIDIPFLTESGVGPVTVTPVLEQLSEELPQAFELFQNYPNPFNPVTTIQFTLPVSSVVTLKIYNVLGQELSTVYDREVMDDGTIETEFDGSNLASGVYFYRLVAESIVQDDDMQESPATFIQTKKMMLIK
ncbi:MAG TPA: Ig-like domain-containing protein [Bacteroidota bacterium]|nr:Ig-like domain-containing protein [Bacteroidota bacterium]